MPHRDPTYRVGYGKPPVETQFKKGKSGNPRGRPAGSLNVNTVLLKALGATVVVNEGGQRVKKTKFEVAIAQLVNKAVSGDLKATDMVLKLHALVIPSADGEVMKDDLAIGGNREEGTVDLTKLSFQELEWLEIIVRKGGPQ